MWGKSPMYSMSTRSLRAMARAVSLKVWKSTVGSI